MKLSGILTVALAGLATVAAAADYQVVVKKQVPRQDDLPKAIAAQLAPHGFAVMRGAKRTVCEIWPCKVWPVKSGFKPTPETLYPFTEGQLIGVLRLTRRGSDFRDQELSKGLYTLRYSRQPVDGNHEGTSPTRDFLLLVPADQDTSAGPLDQERLYELSNEAAGTEHPAMLCMQRPRGDAGGGPSLQHDKDRDWWIAHLPGKAASADKTSTFAIDLVVVGQSSL